MKTDPTDPNSLYEVVRTDESGLPLFVVRRYLVRTSADRFCEQVIRAYTAAMRNRRQGELLQPEAKVETARDKHIYWVQVESSGKECSLTFRIDEVIPATSGAPKVAVHSALNCQRHAAFEVLFRVLDEMNNRLQEIFQEAWQDATQHKFSGAPLGPPDDAKQKAGAKPKEAYNKTWAIMQKDKLSLQQAFDRYRVLYYEHTGMKIPRYGPERARHWDNFRHAMARRREGLKSDQGSED